VWQDYAVPMTARRMGAPPSAAQDDDEGARGQRLVEAVLRRQQERRDLQALLGAPLYTRTTMLPLIGGGVIGPAVDRDRRVLRWGLWAPHRRVLLDVFRRTLPPTTELEDRAAFAEAQGLRYALVRPGMRLTVESLRAWLEGGPGT
jgi:hypothetical protein